MKESPSPYPWTLYDSWHIFPEPILEVRDFKATSIKLCAMIKLLGIVMGYGVPCPLEFSLAIRKTYEHGGMIIPQ